MSHVEGHETLPHDPARRRAFQRHGTRTGRRRQDHGHPQATRAYPLAELPSVARRTEAPGGHVRQVKFMMFELLACGGEYAAMPNPDQAADVTLHEPRDVADFIQALGIPELELELIAIVTGFQKRSPRKITPAALHAPDSNRAASGHRQTRRHLDAGGLACARSARSILTRAGAGQHDH